MNRNRQLSIGIVPATCAVLLVAACIYADKPTTKPEDANTRLVHRFTAAFNAHDVDEMTKFVTNDIEWLSVNGTKIAVDTKGKDQLAAAMKSYFAAIPTVESNVTNAMSAGRYVTVHEQVSWKKGKTRATQSALAVYEIKNDRILRVWYYPAERPSDSGNN